MGFFKKVSKFVAKTSGLASPVSKVLRNQGGALGTVGSIMNPGAAAAEKMAAGAPINARTMTDPNGWIIPTPPPPEAPPEPLPPLVPGAPTALPQGLRARPVPYSYPTTNGQLTKLAYQMAGSPMYSNWSAPQNALGPIEQPSRDVGLMPTPQRVGALGLPAAPLQPVPPAHPLLAQPSGSGKGRMIQSAIANAMSQRAQGATGTEFRPTPGGGVEQLFTTQNSAGLPMLDPLEIARLRTRMGIY